MASDMSEAMIFKMNTCMSLKICLKEGKNEIVLV